MSEKRNLPPSVRLYRVLLRAYPRGFRREYGAQTEHVFRGLYREQRGKRSALMLLWTRTISDLVTTALRERVRPNQEEATMQERRLAVIGFLLLLTPLYFVSASLLKYNLGIGFLFYPLEAFLSVTGRRDVFNVVSPAVFLGGLGLALALNVYAITRLYISRADGTIPRTRRVRLG